MRSPGIRSIPALVLLVTVAHASPAAPIRVSAAGVEVAANAQVIDGVVIGELVPVLRGLGAQATYMKTGGKLSAVAADGRKIEAIVGQAKFTVDGETRDALAAFAAEGDTIIGPITDIADAAGAAIGFAPDGTELRLSHRLASIDTYGADEAAVVHISISGPVDAQLQQLDDPPRAYADFEGVTWLGASETLEMGGTGGLDRVRWALNQEWPPIARIVVGLRPGAIAQMTRVANRLFMLTVRPGKLAESNAKPPSPTRQIGLEDAHIIIDPAAGGRDAGLRGPSISEKSVTLDVAVRLAVLLENAGARATLTRETDVAMSAQARARAAKQAGAADILIRLGCGAGDSVAERGVSTRYGNAASAAFARALQRGVVAELGATDRGIREAADVALPGVSVETCATCSLGMLTSPEEEQLLASQDYRARIASGLFDGIAAYLRGN